MISSLPASLASWRDRPRVRRLNEVPVRNTGRYVLCWLQQALRARDNPVIDAAVGIAPGLWTPMTLSREVFAYAEDTSTVSP